MDGLRTWWDGIEAWLTGLSFVWQLLVTVAVLVPIAVAAALLLNILVNAILSIASRRSPGSRAGRDR